MSGVLAPNPLPPDPLELVVHDQQLAAPPANCRHLGLPDGLSQQDRADAELGGGVRRAGRVRPGRVEVPPQALDIAIVSAGLVLAVAATVLWNWKPDWLELPWVRRERDALHWRLAEEEMRRLKIDATSAQSLAMEQHGDPEGQFGVAGFESVRAYEAREPTWTKDSFPTEREAVTAAEHWLARQGDEAQVEILHFVSNDVAQVVAVVTPDGIERIG